MAHIVILITLVATMHVDKLFGFFSGTTCDHYVTLDFLLFWLNISEHLVMKDSVVGLKSSYLLVYLRQFPDAGSTNVFWTQIQKSKNLQDPLL